jgi:glycosyltransferase involved in cell wall biosynthesis
MSADDRAGDGGGATNGGWLRKLSAAYTEMTNWPDPQAGWLPFALRGGRRLLREWRADVIYASAPPLTGLLVARALSRRFGIPWIAELRDLWVDHPYYEAPAWRRRLERRQEAAVLGSADRLVTVTTPWADLLQERFGQRPEIILNGFDPEDYPADPIESGGGRDELTIVYTGTLYGGRRDPSPLFSAIRSLGAAGRTIRVHFYGAEGGDVELSAAAAGIQDQVRVHPPRPYREIVRIQRSADILLLLRWADDQENGVIPGKVFEYLGARRPILSVGFEGGEVADLIRQRKAGLVSNDPDAIARALSAWLAEKRSGGLADLPLESRLGLSRAEQFATLERLLDSVGRRNLSDPANLLANGRVAGVAMR